MIKYVLLDLDGTLLDFKAGEKNAFIETMKEFSSYTPTDNDCLIFSDINERLFNMFARGEIKERIIFQKQRFKEIAEYLKLALDITAANEFYINSLKYQADMYDDVNDALAYLSNKYELYAASNGQNSVQIKRIEKAGLDKVFNKWYISEIAGANKPDVKFFDYIFNDLNDYNKDSYIIIGDRLDTDVLGGINAGIKTIYLNRNNTSGTIKPDYEIKSLDEIKDVL